MSIRKLTQKNQYAFDVRYMGKRYRKVVTCLQSTVNELYRKWYHDITLYHGVEQHTLHELFDKYLQWSKENKGKRQYEDETRFISFHKRHIPKSMVVDELRRYKIEDIITKLKKSDKSPGTINKYIGSLSYFFNWCIKREYVQYNPVLKCRLREQNERVVSLTQSEITEILDKSSGHLKDAIMIALNTGMRRGELLSMKWSQVNFETRFISLEATQTKGKTRRDIPMPETLYDYLIKLHRGKSKSDTVVQYRGQKVDCLKNSWDGLRKKLSFEISINGVGLRFHDLRHCYATYLRMSGANMSDIQYLLGHKDIKTTQRYAHLTPTTHETVNNMSKIIKVG